MIHKATRGDFIASSDDDRKKNNLFISQIENITICCFHHQPLMNIFSLIFDTFFMVFFDDTCAKGETKLTSEINLLSATLRGQAHKTHHCS